MTSFTSAAPPFEFWEFVCCGVCRLPFLPDLGDSPPLSFWLTECGHVICDHHLSPDRTCSQCGSNPVAVTSLQHSMHPSLSDMFKHIPSVLDAAADAAKFQLETLANLVRHYKSKCMQQRDLLERFKVKNGELKNDKDRLETENQHLRSLNSYGSENVPASTFNGNGKRQMQHPQRGNSTPTSAHHRPAPDRLTLPPEQKRPRIDNPPLMQSTRRRPHPEAHTQYRESQLVTPGPGTRSFQQFAYMPPETPQRPPQAVISHQQAAPTRLHQQRRMLQPQPPVTAVPLDPPRSKFKPVAAGRVQSMQQLTSVARDSMAPQTPSQRPAGPNFTRTSHTVQEPSWLVGPTPSRAQERSPFALQTPGHGPQRFTATQVPKVRHQPFQSAQRRPFQPGGNGFG